MSFRCYEMFFKVKVTKECVRLIIGEWMVDFYKVLEPIAEVEVEEEPVHQAAVGVIFNGGANWGDDMDQGIGLDMDWDYKTIEHLLDEGYNDESDWELVFDD